MTFNLEINLDICTKCGLCERACGLKIVEMKDGIPIENPDMCNSCGHCAAICPVDAIILKDSDMSNFKPLVPSGIKYQNYFNLVRNRKSIRHFKQEPIKEEDLKKLMDSVRYIPTGANRQLMKYLIITNPKQLAEIAQTIAKKFKLLQRLAKPFKAFVPKKEYLALLRLVKQWKDYEKAGYKGLEVFLRGAPCLIVVYAEKQNILSQWEAGIASYNIILAAETLGIGTQLSGYVALTAKAFNSIGKACKVPKKHKILAALILGYPDLEYLKTVDREKLDITRI